MTHVMSTMIHFVRQMLFVWQMLTTVSVGDVEYAPDSLPTESRPQLKAFIIPTVTLQTMSEKENECLTAVGSGVANESRVAGNIDDRTIIKIYGTCGCTQ